MIGHLKVKFRTRFEFKESIRESKKSHEKRAE